MSMEKIKKFVKEYGGIIISGTIGVAGLIILGSKMHGCHKDFPAEAVEENWDICRVADPKAIWAAFDKDGNLVDAITTIDGTIIDPTDFMVFGNEMKK